MSKNSSFFKALRKASVIFSVLFIAIAMTACSASPRIVAIETLSPVRTKTPITTPDPEADVTPEDTSDPQDVPDNSNVTTINIKAVGDIAPQTEILQAAYDAAGDEYDFNALFEKVAEDLDSDYTIASFESISVATSVTAYSGRKSYNTPTSIYAAIKNANIDAVTLANSHILDQGMAGIRSTIEAVESAGLDHFGAYTSLDSANAERYSLVDVKGIKLGILSYSDEFRQNLNDLSSDEKQYATNTMVASNIVSDIQRVRDKGADVVILCMHWGELFTREPNSEQRELAETLLSAGADVILGTHAQQVMKITNKEISRNDGSVGHGIVAYCLGNFVSEYREQYNDSGIILSLNITKDNETGEVTIANPEYIPTYINRVSSGAELKFEVLPIYKYTTGSALDAAALNRMNAAYGEIKAVIGSEAATPK